MWPLLLIPLLAAPRRTSGPPFLSGEVTAESGLAYWAVRPHPAGGYEWQAGRGHLSALYEDHGTESNVLAAVWHGRQAAQRIADAGTFGD